MISSSENVFQVRKRKLCQPSSVSFKGFGVGRSLYTPGPALSHLLPPFHLEGPRFLGCYLQQVWCVPRSQAFSPGWAGEPWLRKSRSSLAVVKVFTLPSPGPLGQKWCSSYWPDKAVKQTAKKTQPSLCSAEITLLEFQYWVIWLLAGALIAKMQIFFFFLIKKGLFFLSVQSILFQDEKPLLNYRCTFVQSFSAIDNSKRKYDLLAYNG